MWSVWKSAKDLYETAIASLKWWRFFVGGVIINKLPFRSVYSNHSKVIISVLRWWPLLIVKQSEPKGSFCLSTPFLNGIIVIIIEIL